MKTLIDLLNETDIGKYLFADKNIDIDKRINDKFKSAFDKFNTIEEPNTDDENKLLDAIYEYFIDNSHSSEIYNAFKELLSLKNKFPRILDPACAQRPENKILDNTVYRCIAMQPDAFSKLIGIDDYSTYYDKCVNDESNEGAEFIEISNNSLPKKCSEGNLFLSFATNFNGARQMAYYRMAQQPAYERPILILKCDYSKLQDKSVLNPDFSETLNPYRNEHEFIYLDTTYQFNTMYLYL